MYTLHRFFLMALDPVHIGTGGYRLGRVDLSIVREPGTNLPKIPGPSLVGAARAYAASLYGDPGCAGQGQEREGGLRGQCGRRDCPVCYTFGYLRGRQSHAGTVSIGDARLLLFPVHSVEGPVWVGTPGGLAEAGLEVEAPPLARGEFATTLPGARQSLNLGWLLLARREGAVAIAPPQAISAPDERGQSAWSAVSQRLVLVDDSLFSQIVNSNLEVRTSVSIDPVTGAAREGALFTYEALPRATWLWTEAVEDDYRSDRFPAGNARAQQLQHSRPLDVVRGGLELAEYLGVGGMGTRGLGRLRLLAAMEV